MHVSLILVLNGKLETIFNDVQELKSHPRIIILGTGIRPGESPAV